MRQQLGRLFRVLFSYKMFDSQFLCCLRAFFYLLATLTSRISGMNLNTTNMTVAQLQAAQVNFMSGLNEIITTYDKKIRPNFFGPPVKVQIEMKVISFGPVDEEKQEYDLDIVFRQWWKDVLLQGAVSQPVTMALDPGTLVWKPDTYFVNAKDSSFHEVTKSVMRVVLKPDGSIYYSSRISLTVTCQMEFHLFPMDVQKCPLYIESYSYTVQEVFYAWYKTNGKLAVTKGVEWIATDGPIFRLANVITYEKDVSNNSKGAFSRLTAEFRLKRRQGYYIWNIYLPGAFLVVMTWVNFWIPASAYPARVTVTITSFLSTVLIIGGAGKSLSRISYLKALDWFLIGNASFVFLTLIEYVLVLHRGGGFSASRKKKTAADVNNQRTGTEFQLGRVHDTSFSHGRDNHAFTLTNHVSANGTSRRQKISENKYGEKATDFENKDGRRRFIDKLLCILKTPGEKKDEDRVINYKGHPIDRLSRVIFPIGYVLFIVVYISYYVI